MPYIQRKREKERGLVSYRYVSHTESPKDDRESEGNKERVKQIKETELHTNKDNGE